MDNVTWPEAIVVLGIIALIIFLIGGGMATYLDMRKMKVTAQQEDDLRQLVRRYEQQILRTVE
jgi:hypothetical protein